jgi:Xaa-Pro aminopeptidase
MVVTVEPGIYIDSAEDIPKDYRGIGIRIEDDVLVTPKGADVLTHEVPKTVEDIESFMGNRKVCHRLDE